MNKEQFYKLILDKIDNGSTYDSLVNTLNNNGRPPLDSNIEDDCYGMVLSMLTNNYIDDAYVDPDGMLNVHFGDPLSQKKAFDKVREMSPTLKPNSKKYHAWLKKKNITTEGCERLSKPT